jgi:hypothetical protein
MEHISPYEIFLKSILPHVEENTFAVICSHEDASPYAELYPALSDVENFVGSVFAKRRRGQNILMHLKTCNSLPQERVMRGKGIRCT